MREFIANYLTVFARTMYSPKLVQTDAATGRPSELNGHAADIGPVSLLQTGVAVADALSEVDVARLVYRHALEAGTVTIGEANSVCLLDILPLFLLCLRP